MLFSSKDNNEVTYTPRRALVEPIEPAKEAVASRKPHIAAYAFALVVLLLALVVGDTQANSVEEASASVSASPVPIVTEAQTATSATPSASASTGPIPKVAKTSEPVKSKFESSENFAAMAVVREPAPERVVSTPSARTSGKKTVKASHRPSSAPQKAVVRKRVSTPKKRVVEVSVASTGSTKGIRALRFAQRQIGEPYARSGAGPSSWDCSGLTMKAWGSVGVRLPHSAHLQLNHGKRISKGNLRRGDLVFFYSPIHHVGIYAGNGKVLHASRPGKPVGYLPMKYMPFSGASRPG